MDPSVQIPQVVQPSELTSDLSLRLGQPSRWLVTGVAGFIGSHLLETLLRHDQRVVGLDNMCTGHAANLEEVRSRVDVGQWARFEFREGDITRPDDVRSAIAGCDYVLHQAALGSVPLSLEEPATTHASNVTGFVNILNAARGSTVRRIVYASSSAVYGDCDELPAREDRIGRPLSPYALSKWMNEQYAAVFDQCYGMASIGLRYFNVCGPRQDPDGAYAAVIPKWIHALLNDQPVQIHGDGEITRDFCPVENIVEANLRSAFLAVEPGTPRVFNVGLGEETTLNQLFRLLRQRVASLRDTVPAEPRHGSQRQGDVRRSRADISLSRRWLGFQGTKTLEAGLDETVRWFHASNR